MFRQVRFECGACGEGFVDWHDQEWERTPVFCVNCGEPIAAGAAVAVRERGTSQAPQPVRSLGVLKSEGDGFPDTLPALRAAQPISGGLGASESGRSTAHGASSDTPPAFAKASSSAPAANGRESRAAARRRKLAPLGAVLVGFAMGVPLALVAEAPVSRLLEPRAHAEAALTRELTAVATAIDEGAWGRARALLVRCSALAPANDRRLATLRARLALGLILANRRDEAAREMAGVAQLPHLHPSQDDLRRVSAALAPEKPSAAAPLAKPSAAAPLAKSSTGAVTAPSASPSAAAVTAAASIAKPASKRDVLTFARDLQRRSQLDDAQHLYEAVLRYHPGDSEARCGLAEVQLLRGSVADAETMFQAALQSNPGYAPAWVGLGDIEWLRGRPELAACRYRAVVNRFPSSSYPPYIAQRIERVQSSGVSVPAPDSAASTPYSCGN